ncbi:MAG: polysaccharide deacetylase family protein [Bacillota bacterium]|nr:polysaccharide deacetylase family protein [Bacillota bacterium]NMA00007.1 polysaccharide deacetylase family protein [Clostridiaceae bacterium]
MIWKNGAKAAFALGFDLDGRTIWRNKAHKLPGGQNFIKGVSIGDFGVKVGTARVLDILDEYDMKATWFIPAEIVEDNPKTVEKILARGHELAHHGYDHRGYYGNTAEEQIAYIERCQNVFLKYAGVKAKGFRGTGSILPETEKWLYTDGGFVYGSCGVSGEACTWIEVEGEKTKAVNIPCRDEMMDDYMQTVMNSYPQVLVGMPRIAPYRNPYENWINEVKGMIRYGTAGSAAFHPQIAGTPGRAIMLERFCRYLAENSSVWCSACIDLAEYFFEHNGDGNHE